MGIAPNSPVAPGSLNRSPQVSAADSHARSGKLRAVDVACFCTGPARRHSPYETLSTEFWLQGVDYGKHLHAEYCLRYILCKQVASPIDLLPTNCCLQYRKVSADGNRFCSGLYAVGALESCSVRGGAEDWKFDDWSCLMLFLCDGEVNCVHVSVGQPANAAFQLGIE